MKKNTTAIPSMSIRNKILRRAGIQPEPELVERASRRERIKRTVWWIGSSSISFGSVILAVSLLAEAVPSFSLTGEVGLLVSIVGVTVAAALDFWLFGWGLNRFDLVEPWQFREEKARE